MKAVAAVLVATLLSAPAARVGAIERGGVPGQGGWVSGGIGQDEIQQLEAERRDHSLWIVTSAKGSGAYLSDAVVTITDRQGRRVFERELAGPWLLVDLAPGTYAVNVRYEGLAQDAKVTIGAGHGVRQMVFRFDVDADVLPRTH